MTAPASTPGSRDSSAPRPRRASRRRPSTAALAGVTYDPTVVRLDRSQRSFKLSFEEFYARRVGPALIRRGQTLMRTHQATLDRIEQRFGVPAPRS